MKLQTVIALLAAAFAAGAVQKESTFNLLPYSTFKPMRMHQEITGLAGWNIFDSNRINYTRNPQKNKGLLDGRDHFKLDCKNGVFSIEFKENKKTPYYSMKGNFSLYPDLSIYTQMPADTFRARGKLKLNKGRVTLFGYKRFKGNGQWQTFDYTFKSGRRTINVRPIPGLRLELKDLQVNAVYEKGIAGSIMLPGGGKLAGLIVSENASFIEKYMVHMWRGYLWRLTGTALPVQEQKKVSPRKGYLVFMQKDLPSGYDLVISKNGGTLAYSGAYDINSALFNYLRKYSYRRYNRNNAEKFPAKDPKRVLLSVNEKCRPKFKHQTQGAYDATMYENGIIRSHDVIGSHADWYGQSHDIVSHISNQLMPSLAKRRAYPACQMMYADGKRQTAVLTRHFMLTSPCLTDPFTRKYMLDRAMEMLKSYEWKNSFTYTLGDNPDAFCHCPRCMKLNQDKTGKSYASIFLDFINDVACRAQKEAPGKTILYCAYQTYTKPPVNRKLPKNLNVEICLTGMEKPCNIHLNCTLNNAAPWKKNIEGWAKLLSKDKIGFATYDVHNPFLIMELMDYLSRYGSKGILLFSGMDAEIYTVARYNQGEDPKKIVSEYFEGIYGKEAGKYVTQVHRTAYEHDKKYKHTPREFSGNPGRMRYRESLDRKTFDTIYALFDKAEKILHKQKKNTEALLWEKFGFMTTDFRKTPRSSCETNQELRAFALRLAEFIRISNILAKSRKYPYYTAGTRFTDWSTPARTFLMNYCGLNVPTTRKFWTDEKVIVDFLKDPVKQIMGSPEKTPGHWRFPYMILRGGENGRILRRASSGKGRIAAILTLEENIRGTVLLTIAGWDDEKPGRNTFKILVNNKEIFSGANTFPETARLADKAPGYMAFSIPAGLLKKGENSIVLLNTVKDDPKRVIRQLKNASKPEDGYTMKQDYFWGWLAIDELRLTAPDHEFYRFSHGRKDTAWGVYTPDKPHADIKIDKGEVFFKTMGSRRNSGIWVSRKSKWILPPGVKFKLRTTFSSTGKGYIHAGFFGYGCDRNGKLVRKMDYQTSRTKAGQGMRTIEKILKTKNHEYICPVFLHSGTGTVTIKEFSLTPIR